MRDGGIVVFEAAAALGGVRWTGSMWRSMSEPEGFSLAPGLHWMDGGARKETRRPNSQHNTTKTKETRRGHHIRQGRGLRSVPSDGGGDFMGRYRDYCLSLGQTHLRGVSAGHFALSFALCIPCCAEATGQWDC